MVRRRQWMATPAGFMKSAATRADEIAADAATPKSSTSIGVISAPPPRPVMPTRKPTTALPRTRYMSRCMTRGLRTIYIVKWNSSLLRRGARGGHRGGGRVRARDREFPQELDHLGALAGPAHGR